MDVYGLLITKGDDEAFGDWCRDQLPFYRAVICLDGSDNDATASQAAAFSEKLIYLHEQDFEIPSKCDHGLRRVVHHELIQRFGPNRWIMCCHTDEFCYHDPRKIAAKADRAGYDHVAWFSPHFYPHPDERHDLPARLRQPVHERFFHYHWSREGNGLPWTEHRMYKAAAHVWWDDFTHGNTSPHGLYRPAPFHPIYRHYKVCSIDLTTLETQQPTTLYSHHWQDQPAEFRTGLPYRVDSVEDLFVKSVRKYARCSRFDGRFDTPWNIGEEYRKDDDLGQQPIYPVIDRHATPLLI